MPEEVNLSVDTSSAFSLSIHQRIGIHGGIVAFAIFVILMRVVFCYLVILTASQSIHNKMLKTILRVPMLFFDTNPIGGCFVVISNLLTLYNSMILNSEKLM